MNNSKEAKKKGSLPRILTHKGAMEEFCNTFREYKQTPPRINLSLDHPGFSFMLACWELMAEWTTDRMAALYEKCTGQQIPSYKSWSEYIHDTKLLLSEVFYITDGDTMTVPPNVAKMWPGGVLYASEEERTKMKKAKEEAAKASKFGGTVKAATLDKIGGKGAKAKPEKAEKPAKAAKPEKAAKAPKLAKGSKGQFAPLGTTDWSACPDEMKISKGKDLDGGPEARQKALALVKGTTTVGKWLEAIVKTLKVKAPKARAIAWPLLNRSYVKKA